MPCQGIFKELDLVRQYWIIRSSPTNQVFKIAKYHWVLNCLGRRSLPIQCQIWMLSRPWIFSGTNPCYFTVAVFPCCRVTGKFSNQAKNCDSWGLVDWKKITNMKTHGCITSFFLLCLLSWIIENPSKHPIDTFTIYILKSNQTANLRTFARLLVPRGGDESRGAMACVGTVADLIRCCMQSKVNAYPFHYFIYFPRFSTIS